MTDKSPTQGIGRGMLIVFWLLVLGALAFFLGNWEERQYNPNQNISGTVSNAKRVVNLERNRYGHYVTTGQLNGSGVVFMLDTGATDVAIPSALAQKLGLKRGASFKVSTANGITHAYATTIRALSIGSITLYDVKAAIAPGMKGNEILLGMSALKQLDFSQSGNTLTLTQTIYSKTE